MTGIRLLVRVYGKDYSTRRKPSHDVATETQPVAAQPDPPGDMFDLGDTELYPKLSDSEHPQPDSAAPAGSASPAEPAPSPADDRPRNPDGTFKAKGPAHPSWLVEQARELGMVDDEDLDIPTQTLSRWVNARLRERVQYQDQYLRERTLSEGQVRNLEPERPKPPAEDDIDLGIDEAQYDPGIIAAMKRLALSSQKRIKDLETKLAQTEQREQAREQTERERHIDGLFDRLGKPYEKLFGSGPMNTIQDQGQRARRIAALQAAIDPKTKQIGNLSQAAKILFGDGEQAAPAGDLGAYEDPAKPTANGAPRITPEQWANGGVAAPTQRIAKELPPGDARAVKNLTEKLRQQNGEVLPDSQELEGFLP